MLQQAVADLAAPFPETAVNSVERALRTVRSHLDMDVGFVSEFVGDQRFMRHVDAKGASPITAGQAIPLEDGYCKKIIDGLLPQLIPDTSKLPEAMAIPETRSLPIGSHLSVPLRLSNGRVYGTFCCFSFSPNATLNGRDLGILKVFADLVAYQIEADVERTRGRMEKTKRIQAALQSLQPAIVYQPWYRLADMQIAGAESLARFRVEPQRSPDVWFAEAGEVGLQVELELAAIRRAVAGYGPVWQRGAYKLSVNSSPRTIVEHDLAREFAGLPAGHVVLEITEHAHVSNYGALLQALKPLRAMGVKIAVDDAGSGYASMRHILNVAPDIIKLDVSMTRNIDTDRMRRALASALIEFSRQTACRIVAEGVETSGEMDTLRQLGVHKAQGYFLSHPLPLPEFLALL